MWNAGSFLKKAPHTPQKLHKRVLNKNHHGNTKHYAKCYRGFVLQKHSPETEGVKSII
jgi:hypothetical protein